MTENCLQVSINLNLLDVDPSEMEPVALEGSMARVRVLEGTTTSEEVMVEEEDVGRENTPGKMRHGTGVNMTVR